MDEPDARQGFQQQFPRSYEYLLRHNASGVSSPACAISAPSFRSGPLGVGVRYPMNGLRGPLDPWKCLLESLLG
jgi:hypothetical protein